MPLPPFNSHVMSSQFNMVPIFLTLLAGNGIASNGYPITIVNSTIPAAMNNSIVIKSSFSMGVRAPNVTTVTIETTTDPSNR